MPVFNITSPSGEEYEINAPEGATEQDAIEYVTLEAERYEAMNLVWGLYNKRSKEYNEEEVEIYKNASDEHKNKMAKTSLTYDGFVVEQEFCNPIKFDDRKMTIAQNLFAKSCRMEVGWTQDGRLVCFDLDEYKKY